MANYVSDAAFFPEDAVIQLENKRTGSTYNITTQVTNFSEGGGDKPIETVDKFGGAKLVVKEPQENYTVDFDVDIRDTLWMEYLSGDVTESGSFKFVVSGGTQDDFKVKLEWTSPTTNAGFKMVYYDANAVTLTKDNAADDRLTGTMSFELPATNSVGSGTKLEFETADITDAGIGSAITGSYGSYEAHYDSIHGYTAGGLL